jgi:hypothetical protein
MIYLLFYSQVQKFGITMGVTEPVAIVSQYELAAT